MAKDIEKLLVPIEQANKDVELAYWLMKSIDKEAAQGLGVIDKVDDVLKLLQKVDNITMDIQIIIKEKAK